MKKIKIFFIPIAVLILFALSCQKKEPEVELIDFESLDLASDSYWNGSDLSGGFTIKNVFFKNKFDPVWDFWSGFSYSTVRDDTTRGIENQYASIAGSGAGGSETYAILFTLSSDTLTFAEPAKVRNVSLCNSTYSYYVMKEGDPQFQVPAMGGEDGTSPDYFKLILEGLDESGQELFNGYVMLADFDQARTQEPYISNVWNDLDLSSFGYVKHLVFSFDSNIRNEFGILIPRYVCLDNIEYELPLTE